MRNLLGAVLMAAGVLIAGTAGLCALLLTVMSQGSTMHWSAEDLFSAIGMVGGPLLVGLGLVWGGRRIQRGGRPGKDKP